MPLNKTPGPDKVSMRVLKDCLPVVLQFNSYLTRNKRLSVHQSGNKKQDNKKLSAVILIYLSKAFDSISHSILLNKLSAIGVSKETVKWFESYLTRRFQKVRIGSSSSAALPITHGVPHVTIAFLHVYKRPSNSDAIM